jgi:hypothetical protein
MIYEKKRGGEIQRCLTSLLKPSKQFDEVEIIFLTNKIKVSNGWRMKYIKLWVHSVLKIQINLKIEETTIYFKKIFF